MTLRWQRKWREANRRPIQGNSPNDRILHGPDWNRYERVCGHFFSAVPLPQIPETPRVSRNAFFRHRGIYHSDGAFCQAGARGPPPVGRPWSPAKERDGRGALCPSSAMSSGRLFLDRGARQHCPSALHRQPDHKTLDGFQERIYYRMVTASFPLCLTKGVHPIISVQSRASAAIPFFAFQYSWSPKGIPKIRFTAYRKIFDPYFHNQLLPNHSFI